MEIRSIGRRLFTDISNDISKLEARLANPKAEFENAHKLIEKTFDERKVELLAIKAIVEKAKHINNEDEVVNYLLRACQEYTGETHDIRTIYTVFQELLTDIEPGELMFAD